MPISPERWRITGAPQRATFGTTDEAAPSVTSDGKMVFISRALGADIWALPIDTNRGKVEGPPKRVTQDAVDDYDPTLSDDGNTVGVPFAAQRPVCRHLKKVRLRRKDCLDPVAG